MAIKVYKFGPSSHAEIKQVLIYEPIDLSPKNWTLLFIVNFATLFAESSINNTHLDYICISGNYWQVWGHAAGEN